MMTWFLALLALPAWPQTMKVPIKNWGLYNTTADSHIHAPTAWLQTEGVHGVLVAVIDTGLDAQHREFKGNLWEQPQKPKIFGWNFVTNGPNPEDDHGHGTHIAGIIGAKLDGQSAISGVSHQLQLLPLKYFSESSSGSMNLMNTVRAIHYAIDQGARIINYSGGGPEYAHAEYLAIKKAELKDVLLVSAAGNEHQDSDLPENAYYPAGYRLKNIISVASTDIYNQLLPSSNYGKRSVDVAAPGEAIYSTTPGGKTGLMTGTSQATAFVSGIAALLLSKHPNLSAPQLKQIIETSVDVLPHLSQKVRTGGRVNATKSLQLAATLAKK
jgi:thermitase